MLVRYPSVNELLMGDVAIKYCGNLSLQNTFLIGHILRGDVTYQKIVDIPGLAWC